MTTHPKNFNYKKSLLVLAFSMGLAFNSGFNYVSNKNGGNADAIITQRTELPSQNQVEYVRLELGMTIAEAQALLGEGTELSRTKSETKLIWRIANGSIVTAFFRDGKLASKHLEVFRACYSKGQEA